MTLEIRTNGMEEISDLKEIPQSEFDELITNHNRVRKNIGVVVEDGIRIGETLVRWKNEVVPEGTWTKWIDSRLPFGHTLAYFYINLFEKRDLVRRETEKLLELPTFKFLSGLMKKKTRDKKRKIEHREYCPTCGQFLSKRVKTWMKKHPGNH